MNKQQQIEWLLAFLVIWDYVAEKGIDQEISGLEKIFECFCSDQQLPHISADELIQHLSDGKERAPIQTIH